MSVANVFIVEFKPSITTADITDKWACRLPVNIFQIIALCISSELR